MLEREVMSQSEDIDVEDEFDNIIRAKWCMDDAATLKEAAEKVRLFADLIDSLISQGYELTSPVQDDYGFIKRSK